MIIVKISELHINKLYGHYNYDVNFNEDVTFIFGSNGCGKTTVLNITQAIITGCLYRLFEYTFKEMELKYLEKGETKTIVIDSINEYTLKITFAKRNYFLSKIENLNLDIKDEEFGFKLRMQYFDRCKVLKEIKETFNYVYLPLNRTSASEYLDDKYIFMKHIYSAPYRNYNNYSKEYKRDESLVQVEVLVYNAVNQSNASIAKINDSFRNEILKSSLSVDADFKFENLLKEMQCYSKEKIREIEKSYVDILTELKIVNDAEKNKYVEFINSIIYGMEHLSVNRKRGDFGVVELTLKFSDILRMKRVANIAEESEKRKANARKTIKLFEDTINSFISNDKEGKEIVIGNRGDIGFRTKYHKEPVSINFLSSGEKQLLIFFAHLIFSVGDNKSGIFVVDEPELSLHLSWQKNFVEKTMSINPNIQLVFATHSPEFVGRYRSKMFRLEKKFQ